MIAAAGVSAQLDMFSAALQEAADDGKEFVRSWRCDNSTASLRLKRYGDAWCYGIDIDTPHGGHCFAPLLKWNKYQSFEDALGQGMESLVRHCSRSQKSFVKLLKEIQQKQPSERWCDKYR